MNNTIKKIVARLAEKTMLHNSVCPQCGAQLGRRCAGGASHQARWDAFKQHILQPKGK